MDAAVTALDPATLPDPFDDDPAPDAAPDDASGLVVPVIDPAGMTVRVIEPPVVVPEVPPHCGDEALTEAPIRVGLWTPTGKRGDWRPFDMEPPGASRKNALIFGTTGGGKSFVLDNLMIGLAPRLHTALSIIDMKGVDCQAWLPRLTGCATTPSEAAGLLRRYYASAQRRKQFCTRYGLAHIPIGLSRMTDGTMWLWPAAPLFVDEAKLVTEDDECADLLDKVGNLGRAFALTLVLATQHPESKAVPTGIKQALPIRVGLACSAYQQVEAGFGRRAVHNDPASLLPDSPLGLPVNQGLAWVQVEEATYRFVRFAFPPGAGASEAEIISKSRCRAIAAGTAHLRQLNLGGQVVPTPSGLVPVDDPWPVPAAA